jgi:hypothetical protein
MAESITVPAQVAGEMIGLCSGLKRTAIGAANAAQRAMLSNFAEIFKGYPFGLHASKCRKIQRTSTHDQGAKLIPPPFEFPPARGKAKPRVSQKSPLNAS